MAIEGWWRSRLTFCSVSTLTRSRKSSYAGYWPHPNIESKNINSYLLAHG